MIVKVKFIYKTATGTFDDVTDVKSAENPISDDHFHSSGAASSGGLLCSNNDLNRPYWPMDHQDLINICVFEQFEGLLFSDLSGPLSIILKTQDF